MPEVIKITDQDEAKAIRDNGGGTLMFPSEYRRLASSEINWGDIRKKYELKGRWEAYVVRSFEGIEDKIQQNKEVQYKHPHFVESTWEGAYKNEDTLGKYASDHPYGDVYLVKL